MDISEFTENRTGKLVRVELPEEDWAFIPDALPPQWEFPVDLWPLLAEAKESLARLDGIGRTLPSPDLLLRPLQSREAIRSSSLEGTYATPEELLLFELHPREPTSKHDPANAWLEVSNYGRALRQGMDLLNELPFCLRLIREIHSTLLEGVRGKDRSPGEFRRCIVHIGSDRRYIPPPPEFLPECLASFEREINEEDSQHDPLVRCYLTHYQFEAIHPFIDGNGRVGRVLLSLMASKWCGLEKPWLYMSAYFEKYKDEYIDSLYRVSTHGDWNGWVKFCLRGTIEQAGDSIRRCDELRMLRSEFLEKAGGLSTRSHVIIEDLFTSPVLTIPEVAKRYSVTYPTAKADIAGLVSRGILVQIPATKPKTFCSPHILGVAYGE